MIPVIVSKPSAPDPLRLDGHAVAEWLVEFLRAECVRRRGVDRVVIGLSGGVDSAVVAYLCARAFGAEKTHVFRMPYKLSSSASLTDAQLVIDDLRLPERTIDITPMVDGYLASEPDASATRIGNVCARCRANILFDQSAKLRGLPIGTGNKTERLFGYFTWHADDSPPVNPLGDLFKSQVWELAKALGVPTTIINKPASADLVKGQTDEGDFGIRYVDADPILHYIVSGYPPAKIVELGFPAESVDLVWNKVAKTHWKRHLPTIAMLSPSAINEYYLRPVDY
jgi:NAD+ synthase